jgi:hypothetical protein
VTINAVIGLDQAARLIVGVVRASQAAKDTTEEQKSA